MESGSMWGDPWPECEEDAETLAEAEEIARQLQHGEREEATVRKVTIYKRL